MTRQRGRQLYAFYDVDDNGSRDMKMTMTAKAHKGNTTQTTRAVQLPYKAVGNTGPHSEAENRKGVHNNKRFRMGEKRKRNNFFFFLHDGVRTCS